MSEPITDSRIPFNLPNDRERAPFGVSSGAIRALLLIVIYSGVIAAAHWFAFLIRFEFHPPTDPVRLFWETLQWILPVELLSLFLFGQYRSLLSYFSLPDAMRIGMMEFFKYRLP